MLATAAVNDITTVSNADGLFTIDVLLNDINVSNSDVITNVTATTVGGAIGTFSISADGKAIYYKPSTMIADYSGKTETATYTITGGFTATITVNVEELVELQFDDEGGMDDESHAPSDITATKIEYLAASGTTADPDISVYVQMDNTNYSGASSSEISILFDGDGDGFADFSIFVVLEDDASNGIAAVSSLTIYDGTSSDSNALKLKNPVTAHEIIPTNSLSGVTNTTASVVSTTEQNPFTTATDLDVVVKVDIDLDYLASLMPAGTTASDIKFLNIVTHPSSSPTSNTKDVFFETVGVDPAANADTATTTEDTAGLYRCTC